MENQVRFDVFLSHSSRDRNVALALCHYLEDLGLRCWMAPRDIVPGQEYAEAIIEGIVRSRMMVVIFSGHSNRSKHVRNEVERAFNHQLPIVPFRIEDVIPENSLEYFLSATHWLDALEGRAEDYFEQVGQTCAALVSGGTPPVPAKRPVSTRRRARRRLVAGLVAGAVLLAAGIVTPFWLADRHEKVQIANALVGDMILRFGLIDQDLVSVQYSKDQFVRVAANGDTAETAELVSWIDHELAKTPSAEPFWNADVKQKLGRTDIPVEDVQAFYATILPQLNQEKIEYYKLLRAHLVLPRSSWLSRLPEFFTLDAEALQVEAEGYYYAFLELMNSTPPESRALFQSAYSSLTKFPRVASLTKEQAKAEQDRSFLKLQQITTDLASIIPKEERDVDLLAKSLEALNQKKALVETRKQQVAVAQTELELARDRLREKFKLLPEDDPGLMWGKILKFASVKLWDDAARSCDLFVQLAASREPEVKLYGPAGAAYYRAQKTKPLTVGVIIAAIENGAPHSVLKVGDIIVKSRGLPVATVADFGAAAKREGERVVEILRLDAQGGLRPLTVVSKPEDPRVGVMPLLGPTE